MTAQLISIQSWYEFSCLVFNYLLSIFQNIVLEHGEMSSSSLIDLSQVSQRLWSMSRPYINTRCTFRYASISQNIYLLLCSISLPFRIKKYNACNFSEVLSTIDLPLSTRELSFCKAFNNSVDNLQHYSITSLTFGKFFNASVESLPLSLTHLTFGRDFDQPVDMLPKFLTHLTFAEQFDRPVDRLPSGLMYLNFNGALKRNASFNQSVDALPQSLITLELSSYFDRSVDALPQHLKNLTFGFAFNKPVENLPQRESIHFHALLRILHLVLVLINQLILSQ